MAKTEVVMARQDWMLVKETLGASGAQTVEEQAKKFKLHCKLENAADRMEGRDDEEFTVALTAAQMRTLVEVMNRPPVAWRISATPRIWKIKMLLGWTPNAEEGVEDDEDEESEEVTE